MVAFDGFCLDREIILCMVACDGFCLDGFWHGQNINDSFKIKVSLLFYLCNIMIISSILLLLKNKIFMSVHANIQCASGQGHNAQEK